MCIRDRISTGTEVTTLLLLNFDTDANFDSVVDSTNMTTTYPSTDAKFGDRGATFSRPNADYLLGTWPTNIADEKFTLEFHIKTTDTDYVSSIGRHIFAPASGTNVSNGFQIFRDPEGGTAKSPHSDNAQGALMLNMDATAGGYLCSTRTVDIADGQFHFVVFQHEGNAVYSCYVDGILQERRTYGGGAVNFANNGGYLIGGRADANAESYFTGTLDALALYVADIKFTGNTGGGGNEPPGQENTFDGAVLNDLIDVDTQTSLPQHGSVLVYDNTDGKWKPGGFLPYRTTQNVVTSSLADGASEDVVLTGTGKAGQFISVTTDRAAWVTIYTDTASRTADAGRAETIDPAPGSGVLMEVISTGAETVRVTPAAGYFNDEATPAAELYLKVVNKSGSTSTVQVDVKATVLEN